MLPFYIAGLAEWRKIHLKLPRHLGKSVEPSQLPCQLQLGIIRSYLAVPVGLRCTPLPHFARLIWDHQMTATAFWRQRGLLLRSPGCILITVVGLLSMGFDTLRTVKADTNETVLEGSLIRYGESAAQIAFATGESRTCTRDGRRHL